MKKILVALLSIAVLVGCKTTAIRDDVIAVPPGLEAEQVEVALIAAIFSLTPPSGSGMSNPEAIADSALKAAFGWRYQSINPRRRDAGRWHLEGRDHDRQIVYAGYQNKANYMRVAMTYTANDVRFSIVDSTGLRQSETKIHRAALAWMDELKMSARRTLGQAQLQ